MTKNKAFTLVELAIVMTIIGLLIGGILKGQELLENARVTATIAQVKSYDAAVTGFRDIYDGLPGDLRNAGSRIPGCTVNCTPEATQSGNNYVDNAVADGDWFTNFVHDAPPSSAAEESRLFWLHLLKANLITGVTDRQMTETGFIAEFGKDAPAAKVGGGFYARSYGSGGSLPYSTNTGKSGLLLELYPVIFDDLSGAGEGVFVLTPARARQIDAKMDDGIPDTGSVFAVSYPADRCVTGSGSTFTYDASRNSKNCTLVFVIQQ